MKMKNSEKSEPFSEKSIHNFSDSDYLLNHQQGNEQKNLEATFVCKFLKGI